MTMKHGVYYITCAILMIIGLVSPASLAAMEPSEVVQRNVQRQDRLENVTRAIGERKVQVHENRCERVRDRIGEKKERITTRGNTAVQQTDRRSGRREQLARLSELGCDTSSVLDALTTLETMMAEFAAKRQEIATHLQSWSDELCASTDSLDHERKATFRAEHQAQVEELRALGVRIKEYRATTLATTFETFAQQCRADINAENRRIDG